MTKEITLITPVTPAVAPRRRIWSIDILRGAVIVLMALDHVRHIWSSTPFEPTDLSQTTPAWFFLRWITHFCAPVFVFLAGTSAFLYGSRLPDRAQLRSFLFTRGVWLVLMELTLVNLGIAFAPAWQAGFVLLQVIWAIGWSMIALAALVSLPMQGIAALGLALVLGHNLLDDLNPEVFGTLGWLWQILHVGNSPIPVGAEGGFQILVLYPLIPWIGVMALGYAFGPVMRREAADRRRFLLRWGLGALVLFVALRATNLYGDPSPWAVQDRGALFNVLSFLNVTKYPPSLLYLSLTLGPALLLLAALERVQGPAARVLRTFGRVPFFFYLIHFPLINLGAWIWHSYRYGRGFQFLTTPPDQWPADYAAGYGLTLLVWAGISVLMYFLCKWYEGYKFGRDYWWLKFL